MMSRSLWFALACGVLSAQLGCIFGTSASLLAEANTQLIITGVAVGDVVDVEVSDVVRSLVVDERSPVVMYLDLAQGQHDGALRWSRGGDERCFTFVVDVDNEDEGTSTSVDVRSALPCTPTPISDAGMPDAGVPDAGDPIPDAGPTDGGGDMDAGIVIDIDAGLIVDAGVELDAGLSPADAGSPDVDAGSPDIDAGEVFDAGVPTDAGLATDAGVDATTLIRLEVTEQLVFPCTLPPCDIITTIEADGAVSVQELALVEQNGTVPGADIDLFSQTLLSAEADALFAGADPSCPQPRGVQLENITLVRTRLVNSVEEDDSVDVSGCDAGIAADIRARVVFLRTLALAP